VEISVGYFSAYTNIKTSEKLFVKTHITVNDKNPETWQLSLAPEEMYFYSGPNGLIILCLGKPVSTEILEQVQRLLVGCKSKQPKPEKHSRYVRTDKSVF